MTNSSSHIDSNEFINVFEERAEFLSRKELVNWTAKTKKDKVILTKLKGPGAKLLSGPRGSGKSTFLKRSYFELLKDKKALGVYVNYSRSLALEPLFHKTANAPQLFRQWVLAKIVEGVYVAMDDLGVDIPGSLDELHRYSVQLMASLQKGDELELIDLRLTPSSLLKNLEFWASEIGRNRVVLLFDDAAHAFSLEQQRDFFEVFRELRSRRISAKAAIYPGVTSFSPSFHVGHEAEVVETWIRPDDSEYLSFMRSIFDKRMPADLKRQFDEREDFLDVLALASYGLPRGFINMLSDVLQVDDEGAERPTRRRVFTVISDHAQQVRGVFDSLSVKLPRFKNFVEVGRDLENGVSESLKRFNKAKPVSKKATVIAISDPIPPELDRILKFLQYAGIFHKMASVSRGEKGVFHRYSMHFAILISENALSLGKSFTLSELVQSLITNDAHAFARSSAKTLLGGDFSDRCILDLPPCEKCGAQRISEKQKFCMECGAELSDASIYEELLNSPISKLPITSKKVQGIYKHTGIKTVQDLLADDEQVLLDVPYIGRVWAKRIKTYAEEFVSV